MNGQPSPHRLASLLRSARRRAGLTQEQLAGLSTVSMRAIRDLERGRVLQPRNDTLRLLADALRLTKTRRAELELAVPGKIGNETIGAAFSTELVPPPRPTRPLLGRDLELRALTDLLDAGSAHLVSLVGLPGVGKTRLAVDAARALHTRERFSVLWVAMDDVENVRASRLSPRAALVGWVRDLLADDGSRDDLASVIGDKPTLLVLDGHDDAPVGPGLLDLLQSCESLKVLVTSRRPLHAPGGELIPLAPLPLPDPCWRQFGTPQTDNPALRLMLDHVSYLRLESPLTDGAARAIVDVCHALDGIPEALESASSWLLLHSAEQLREFTWDDPLELVDGAVQAAPSGRVRFSRRLASVLAGLTSQETTTLAGVAALPGPWSVKDAAEALGGSQAAAARHVHTLFLHGLIRPYRAGLTAVGTSAKFTVLNLTRRLLSCLPPAALGYRGGLVASRYEAA